jgi:hypothetical protein
VLKLYAQTTRVFWHQLGAAFAVLKMSHKRLEFAKFSDIEDLKMSQLSALLFLLTEACQSVEREYAKTSKALPSLDDTYLIPSTTNSIRSNYGSPYVLLKPSPHRSVLQWVVQTMQWLMSVLINLVMTIAYVNRNPWR